MKQCCHEVISENFLHASIMVHRIKKVVLELSKKQWGEYVFDVHFYNKTGYSNTLTLFCLKDFELKGIESLFGDVSPEDTSPRL